MATERQKRAAVEILEKGRGSVSGVMREVGYSPKSAVDPSKLTKSKGWAELLEQYLPERKLAEAHAEALDATKTENKEKVPDHGIRLKAVELGYKLRKRIDKDESSGLNYHLHLDESKKEYLEDAKDEN